jgi:DNA-3-methyladenine glycosylase II
LPRLITSREELSTGIAHIVAVDPAMARSHALAGMPEPRISAPGLDALCRIVIGQQVSTASARAIEARFAAEFGAIRPEALMDADEPRFRRAGLSAPKIRALRAIGEAMLAGALDLDALAGCEADEAHRRLCAVKGVGPWTADIYLMFALGHADAFPAGDLALQEAIRLIDGGAARPKPDALLCRVEPWRPWRAAGALMLWRRYHVAKGLAGIS